MLKSILMTKIEYTYSPNHYKNNTELLTTNCTNLTNDYDKNHLFYTCRSQMSLRTYGTK